MSAYTSTEVGAPSRGSYLPGDTVTDARGIVYKCIRGGQAALPGAGSEGAAEFIAVQGSLGKQAAPVAKTTSATLTAAEILAGLITGNQGAGAGAAYTLPLGTDLEAALLALFPGLSNDDSFDFFVINLSVVAAEDITMTTNTGWTLVGDMVVESNDNTAGAYPRGQFRVRRTAANTYSLYRIA